MKKFWAILLAMMLVLSMVTVAGATEVESVYGRGRRYADCYRLYDSGKSEGRCHTRIRSVPDFHC